MFVRCFLVGAWGFLRSLLLWWSLRCYDLFLLIFAFTIVVGFVVIRFACGPIIGIRTIVVAIAAAISAAIAAATTANTSFVVRFGIGGIGLMVKNARTDRNAPLDNNDQHCFIVKLDTKAVANAFLC